MHDPQNNYSFCHCVFYRSIIFRFYKYYTTLTPPANSFKSKHSPKIAITIPGECSCCCVKGTVPLTHPRGRIAIFFVIYRISHSIVTVSRTSISSASISMSKLSDDVSELVSAIMNPSIGSEYISSSAHE